MSKKTKIDQTVTYTLFGKEVKPGTLMYKLCAEYYGDFHKFENDLETTEPGTPTSCLMLDIRDAFCCNEFRTEDVVLRRKVLYDNYYCVTNEEIPI